MERGRHCRNNPVKQSLVKHHHIARRRCGDNHDDRFSFRRLHITSQPSCWVTCAAHKNRSKKNNVIMEQAQTSQPRNSAGSQRCVPETHALVLFIFTFFRPGWSLSDTQSIVCLSGRTSSWFLSNTSCCELKRRANEQDCAPGSSLTWSR